MPDHDRKRFSRLLNRLSSAWVVLTLLCLTAIGVAISLAGDIIHLTDGQDKYLESVGSSILVSIIVFLLISLVLEPPRQRAQAESVSINAIEVANEQFQRRFAASLPTASYEESRVPRPSFRQSFVHLLSSSTRYDYKGDSANFTSFRLHELAHKDEIRRIETRICVLDPREEHLLRAHTEHRLARRKEMATAEGLSTEMEQIREDLFVSIVTLFEIRHNVTTNLYFHHDLPFFRCEMFDDGMFLTYYLGSAAYPETLHFTSRTRPYMAYNKGLELTRRFASMAMYLSSVGPSADLVDTDEKLLDRLHSLGCDVDLDVLRPKMEKRFETLRIELQKGGVSSQELF